MVTYTVERLCEVTLVLPICHLNLFETFYQLVSCPSTWEIYIHTCIYAYIYLVADIKLLSIIFISELS